MLDVILLIIGISGVIAIALNFILEATNRLKSDHHSFAIINLYGSCALFIYSLYNLIWLFVILNGFLILVGVYGLYKVLKK
ncbi:MAG: CBU_0592 family membrane protein [Nanoarchaeota archaeon]